MKYRRLWTTGCQEYKGMTMWCAPGTHSQAAAMIESVLSPRASILDLGAGSGAFLARLRDIGYLDLEAADICTEQFKLEDVPLHKINLNTTFSDKISKTFDCVSAIEVIEHLESPRQFLREIRQLLDRNGWLLLSTPNIENLIGRVHFLRTGRLRYFDDKFYHEQRHISIIPDNHVRLIFGEIGYQIVSFQTTGSFLKSFLRIPISLFVSNILNEILVGDVRIYLARVTTPKTISPGQHPNYAKYYL